MAHLHRKQQLQGLIGPLYMRELNGKTIVQTRPVNPKQSKGTQASGTTFKYAVAQAKLIKLAFRTLLLAGTDAYASQRLTGALQKAFHFRQGFETHSTLFTADLNGLIGFEFNDRNKLQDCLPMALPFAVTNSGTVKLESTNIPSPDRHIIGMPYLGAQLAVMVVGFHPGGTGTFVSDTVGFDLSLHLPTAISLESQPFPPGTRVFVVAQLLLSDSWTALGDRNYVNSKLFNPVGVVWTGMV